MLASGSARGKSGGDIVLDWSVRCTHWRAGEALGVRTTPNSLRTPAWLVAMSALLASAASSAMSSDMTNALATAVSPLGSAACAGGAAGEEAGTSAGSDTTDATQRDKARIACAKYNELVV